MAEYIEREASLKAILDLPPKMDEQGYGWLGLRGVWQMLLDFPAADVQPVRHGRWYVSRTDYGWNGVEFPTHSKCSLCDMEIPYQDQNRYCPNCGAKMDKEVNE